MSKYDYDEMDSLKEVIRIKDELSLGYLRIDVDGSVSAIDFGRSVTADELQSLVDLMRKIEREEI